MRTKRKWTNEFIKSMPWSDPEFFMVNGFKCIYEVKDGTYIIHMPGGVSYTPEQLTEWGIPFAYPSILRPIEEKKEAVSA